MKVVIVIVVVVLLVVIVVVVVAIVVIVVVVVVAVLVVVVVVAAVLWRGSIALIIPANTSEIMKLALFCLIVLEITINDNSSHLPLRKLRNH